MAAATMVFDADSRSPVLSRTGCPAFRPEGLSEILHKPPVGNYPVIVQVFTLMRLVVTNGPLTLRVLRCDPILAGFQLYSANSRMVHRFHD